ncbi:hypothetical protein KCU85_g10, partial [Aureobasidium melanogenum]
MASLTKSEALENDTLLCVLQAISFGGVLVVAFKSLDLNVIAETVIKRLAATDVELQVPEVFDTRTLVVDVDAAEISSVPFIFSSNLSIKMRESSWTSCCSKTWRDSHPND